jgi:hypothetical protein
MGNFLLLQELLREAKYCVLTEDEQESWAAEIKLHEEKTHIKELHDMIESNGEKTIGEHFSSMANHHWRDEKNACLRMMLAFIKSNGSWHSSLIIGFIAAWANSEIQHPVLERMVKHTLNNNLLKYPLTTKVSDYEKSINTKPSHAPKKDVIEYLPTLMTFFEVKTINGTGTQLKIDNKTVRSHLTKLAEGDYKILIDESFEHYKWIKKVHAKWVLINK